MAASLAVVTAWADGQLIGLARVVGDGLTIVYLQDILVTPEHQRGGVGRELFRRVFEPFDDVKQTHDAGSASRSSTGEVHREYCSARRSTGTPRHSVAA